jgi:major membrane immunogen (membrane-anchored lipoprotein)
MPVKDEYRKRAADRVTRSGGNAIRFYTNARAAAVKLCGAEGGSVVDRDVATWVPDTPQGDFMSMFFESGNHVDYIDSLTDEGKLQQCSADRKDKAAKAKKAKAKKAKEAKAKAAKAKESKKRRRSSSSTTKPWCQKVGASKTVKNLHTSLRKVRQSISMMEKKLKRASKK